MSTHLVLYMSPWCVNCLDTQDALAEWHVEHVVIDVKKDKAAAGRVRTWTGFESVPTLVIAEADSVDPCPPPAPLAAGASPRGIDRGTMLTEPNRKQLRAWLVKNGMLEK